jgi:AcrR family transcriptional regulator
MSAQNAGPAVNGHRQTESGRRARERIVEVAADLMYQHGVAGTSIPDIQDAAHVSASQIYHYFGDKHGLVRAVIEYQIAAVLDMQRPFLEDLDTFDALRAWCDSVAERQESHDCKGGCEIGSLASELVDASETARADLVAAFARWEEPIRRGLSRMQDRGELRRDADVQALATALLAAVQGGLLLTQVRRSSTPLRQVTSAVIDHIETFAVNP